MGNKQLHMCRKERKAGDTLWNKKRVRALPPFSLPTNAVIESIKSMGIYTIVGEDNPCREALRVISLLQGRWEPKRLYQTWHWISRQGVGTLAFCSRFLPEKRLFWVFLFPNLFITEWPTGSRDCQVHFELIFHESCLLTVRFHQCLCQPSVLLPFRGTGHAELWPMSLYLKEQWCL